MAARQATTGPFSDREERLAGCRCGATATSERSVPLVDLEPPRRSSRTGRAAGLALLAGAVVRVLAVLALAGRGIRGAGGAGRSRGAGARRRLRLLRGLLLLLRGAADAVERRGRRLPIAVDLSQDGGGGRRIARARAHAIV